MSSQLVISLLLLIFSNKKSSRQQRKITNKRIKAIIAYLVDKQGFSAERFEQVIDESQNMNLIEMLQLEL